MKNFADFKSLVSTIPPLRQVPAPTLAVYRQIKFPPWVQHGADAGKREVIQNRLLRHQHQAEYW